MHADIPRTGRAPASAAALLLVALLPAVGRAGDGVEFFEKKVRPVLLRECERVFDG